MQPLIDLILTELRRVLVDRLVNEIIGEMTFREFAFFILGVLCTLLILGLQDMQPTVIFFHIDKTGGTTVRDYLSQQYPREQIRPVPGMPAIDQTAVLYPVTHQDLYAHNRKFKRDRTQRLIMGHYDTGILDYFDDDVVTMTVLREPVARVVSLYRYVRENEPRYAGLSRDAQVLGFDAWARKYCDLWDNAMTKQLAGVRWSSGWTPASNAVYQLAEQMLRELTFVGLTERLDLFLDCVADEMGWDAPEPRRLNRTQAPDTPVSRDTRAFIMQHTAWDRQLSNVAKEIAV